MRHLFALQLVTRAPTILAMPRHDGAQIVGVWEDYIAVSCFDESSAGGRARFVCAMLMLIYFIWSVVLLSPIAAENDPVRYLQDNSDGFLDVRALPCRSLRVWPALARFERQSAALCHSEASFHVSRYDTRGCTRRSTRQGRS